MVNDMSVLFVCLWETPWRPLSRVEYVTQTLLPCRTKVVLGGWVQIVPGKAGKGTEVQTEGEQPASPMSKEKLGGMFHRFGIWDTPLPFLPSICFSTDWKTTNEVVYIFSSCFTQV